MIKNLILGTGTLAFIVPAVARAQATVANVLETVTDILNATIPIVIAILVIYFVWGLANYILKAGDEDGRKGARDTMIWGVIALFVILSVWGLVGVLQNTFNVDNTETINIPTIGT